ncbi:MAG: DSD1 family PLP-dependent enzyme [Kiloniellales bacterium]
MSESPNKHLIGQEGSRLELSTPALVIDMPTFRANLRSGQEIISNNGVGLRPHVKTHKCVHIAKLQMQAGAKGVCCAKLGEAEALFAGGIKKILLTSPVVEPAKIQRLAEINKDMEDLMVVVDDLENIKALQQAARAVSKKFRLLVDVDIGLNRSGVTSVEQGLTLARYIAEAPELRFFGLQGYSGDIQHIKKTAERRRVSHEQLKILKDMKKAIKEAKIPVRITTGSGTGSHLVDMEAAVFNDLQLGSYIFMDTEYQAIHLKLWGKIPYHPALFVYTRVVSNNHEGFVTLDAGSKSLATDGPLPTVVGGAPDGSTYEPFGDEFGKLVLPEGAEPPATGSLIVLMAPHCDPTVNLYDHYHCVRDDKLVAIWDIQARGRAS